MPAASLGTFVFALVTPLLTHGHRLFQLVLLAASAGLTSALASPAALGINPRNPAATNGSPNAREIFLLVMYFMNFLLLVNSCCGIEYGTRARPRGTPG